MRYLNSSIANHSLLLNKTILRVLVIMKLMSSPSCNKTYLEYEGKQVPIKIFGRHNMQNLAGAKKILNNLGISNKLFFRAIKTFKLPNQRLEILYNKKRYKSTYSYTFFQKIYSPVGFNIPIFIE